MFEGLKVSATWKNNDNDMDNWKVYLSRNGGSIQVPFRQGYGFKGQPPTVDSVIECLVMDALAGQDDYDDFCGNFGYDEDSREAHKTWKSCKKINEKIQRVLDHEELQAVAEGESQTMNRLAQIKTKNN